MAVSNRLAERRTGGPALPPLVELIVGGEKEQSLCELIRSERLLEQHRSATPWCELGSRRAWLEQQNATTGWAPMHTAASADKSLLLRQLVVSGARVDIADQKKQTALMIASARGYKQSVKILLEMRAAVGAADGAGKSPLHHAVSGSSDAVHVIAMLLGAKADVNARDNAGLTPLSVATAIQDVPCIEALLTGNANPLVLDCNNRTLLEHARATRRQLAGARMERTWMEESPLALESQDAPLTSRRTVAFKDEALAVPRPATAPEQYYSSWQHRATWNYPRWDNTGECRHQNRLLHADREARRRVIDIISPSEQHRLRAATRLLS